MSELIALERSWLQLDEALVRVRGGGRPRAVPLGRQAVLALRRYGERGRPGPGDRHRLLRVSSSTPQGGRCRAWGVWKILRAAADGRRDSPPRQAPRCCATASPAISSTEGAPLQDVQLLLGHARITTTQVYARRSDHCLLEVHRSYHPRP